LEEIAMRQNTERTYKERILRVLVYIQSHLDEAFSLEELAALAHFSPHHFHRIFRGMVGESVMEHIRRLRLERAAHRLKFTDHPVTRIAFEAGYETHEAFTRAFGAMFGKSPSHFREKHRSLPFPQVPSGIHYQEECRLDGFRDVQEGRPPLDVQVVSFPATRLAFMLDAGPYSEVGLTWSKLFTRVGPRGLIGRSTRILGLVHDDPEVTPADKVRYDACIVVDERFQPEGDLGLQEISGEYAVATHRGPYETAGETYARVCGRWLPGSGRELRSAPSVEVYRNSPRDTRPEDLLTDIHLPLADELKP
jgi:AraC family transcriptional regulator